jgi:plasmid stabilization system protein ParE
MAKTKAEQIAALQEKQRRNAERLNRLTAEAKKEEKARDLHRKIFVGGAVLAAMPQDTALADKIRQVLAAAEIRPHDRAVIDDLLVPPAPAGKPQQAI